MRCAITRNAVRNHEECGGRSRGMRWAITRNAVGDHITYSSHSNTSGNLGKSPHALATRPPPRSEVMLIWSCSLHAIWDGIGTILSLP